VYGFHRYRVGLFGIGGEFGKESEGAIEDSVARISVEEGLVAEDGDYCTHYC
jgi:hypothetical protein